MREFADLAEEEPHKFLDSERGTLYSIDGDRGYPVRMVRRFNRTIPPEAIPAYAELVAEADEWLARQDDLGDLARVVQPTEVGRDFIARDFHVYATGTRAYVEWEDPPEPPAELERMRAVFRALPPPADAREALLREVLARSILEPTSSTYFDESMRQFVVVEPLVTADDVQRWETLPADS